MPSRRAKSLFPPLVAALVVLMPTAAALAVSTRVFQIDTAEQLEQGELDQVSVSSLGEVKLGRALERIEAKDVALVWSALEAPDGTVFLGTGNNGQVLRLRGSRLEELAKLDALVVTSLALGPGGTLYAGTLPGAKIYRIDTGSALPAKATLHVELEKAEHVWALEYDSKRSVVFAATGPEGIVYSVDQSGRAQAYYESDDDHVLALALDRPGGDLLAGTSPEAKLLRITGPGKAYALYDFDGTEVKGIARKGEDLYVAVNTFPEPPAPPKAASTKTDRGGTKGDRARPKPGKGKVYRYQPAGSTELLVAFDDGHLTTIQTGTDGLVYAGTGAKGRLLAVDDDRVSYTIADVEERQVLALSLAGKSPIIATGDAGAVYRLSDGAPTTAEYRTAPLDAGFVSDWGALEWRGEGNLVVDTRSGNTAEPDATWSDWSGPIERTGAKIKSGSARYLQVRARWTKDRGAILRALQIYHLPRNQRGVVTKVEVESAEVFVRPGAKTETKTGGRSGKSGSAGGDVPSHSPQLKVTWTVDNPDEDDLRYRLYFREESESVWHAILRSDEVLTKATYEWNTENVPTGYYLVKVEASDEMVNPASRSLEHVKVSPPVLVDNEPPRLVAVEARGRGLRGEAVDSFSQIERIDYSLDGREWHPVFPSDGLFDGRTEAFSFDLPRDLAAGAYTLVVRSFDRAGNRAAARLAISLPPSSRGAASASGQTGSDRTE